MSNDSTTVVQNAPRRIGLYSILPRFTMWWRHIVPPMYAFIYLSILASDTPLSVGVIRLACYTLAIIGTAAFGYFLNDWSDIEQDAKAQKPNRAAGLSQSQRLGIALVLLLCSWVPWVVLPRSVVNMVFMALQYAALVSYSCPPLRLKERKQWGLICDMLYGHLIPIVVTVATFNDEASYLRSWPLYGLLLPWLACKGLRNISLHQVSDRAKDRKGGVATLVRRFGPLRTIKTINFVLLPLELLTLSVLLVYLALCGAPLYVGFCAFLLFTCLKFSIWKVVRDTARKRLFKFLYFVNDFYEEWLPVVALVALTVVRPEAIFLLVAHLCMFPWAVMKLGRDAILIRRNVFGR